MVDRPLSIIDCTQSEEERGVFRAYAKVTTFG